jgi:hypothetical protein
MTPRIDKDFLALVGSDPKWAPRLFKQWVSTPHRRRLGSDFVLTSFALLCFVRFGRTSSIAGPSHSACCLALTQQISALGARRHSMQQAHRNLLNNRGLGLLAHPRLERLRSARREALPSDGRSDSLVSGVIDAEVAGFNAHV